MSFHFNKDTLLICWIQQKQAYISRIISIAKHLLNTKHKYYIAHNEDYGGINITIFIHFLSLLFRNTSTFQYYNNI